MENIEKELSTQDNANEELTFFELFIGIFLFGLYCAIIIGVLIAIPFFLTVYISGWYGLLFIITLPLTLASLIAPLAKIGGSK